MKLEADGCLKAQLRSVLWIGGAACGGKTTIADQLAERYGFQAYHSEDFFHEHRKAAPPEDCPALHAPFHGWEWFFNRPLEEYIRAIEDSEREQFVMAVEDLVRISSDTQVVADAFFLDPQWARRQIDRHRSIFLYARDETIRSGFFARADKVDLCQAIDTLADPAGTRDHCLDVTCTLSARKRKAAEAAGVRVLVRDGQADLLETLTEVEGHFCLV